MLRYFKERYQDEFDDLGVEINSKNIKVLLSKIKKFGIHNKEMWKSSYRDILHKYDMFENTFTYDDMK